MNGEKAIITFEIEKRQTSVDLEVPLDISADELVKALNTAYSLELDCDNPRNCFMPAENPIVLLKGNRTLKDFGIHNGSVLRFTRTR